MSDPKDVPASEPLRTAVPSNYVSRTRAILYGLLLALVGFVAGTGWQYFRAQKIQRELDSAQHALAFQQMQATLGAATVDAQRGAFEPARQLTSQFFTDLQTHRTEAPASAQPELDQILGQRDAVITSLSRSDVQSGAVLGNLLTRLRGALGEGGGSPPASTAPASTAPASTAPGS